MERSATAGDFTPLELVNSVYGKERTLFGILAVLATLVWVAVVVGTLGVALLYILMFFVIYLFTQSAFISYLKGTAVEITPEQFPQLHAQLLECCRRLDMPVPPRAYLLAADGMLNALATRFLRRNYIVLFSSIVDALESDKDAINFYIGHELGHIRRNHLGKAPFLFPVAWLPLLGAAYSRACEYTCDLHGLRCCNSKASATNAVAVLAAGVEQWKRMNVPQYLHQIGETGRFWMSLHELTGNYPWLTKRMGMIHARAQAQEFKAPSRNPFAFLFALFIPRTFGGAAIGGMLVIFVIIGMLAAVAIPAYKQYMDTANLLNMTQPDSVEYQDTRAGDPERAAMEIDAQVRTLQPVLDAIVNHHRTQGEWPESLQNLSLPGNLLNGMESLELYEEGALGFRGSEALGEYQEYETYLAPQLNAQGDYEWVCWSPYIPDDYLPHDCKG